MRQLTADRIHGGVIFIREKRDSFRMGPLGVWGREGGGRESEDERASAHHVLVVSLVDECLVVRPLLPAGLQGRLPEPEPLLLPR